MFNSNQKDIHTLYADDAKYFMTLYAPDATIELKSALEIRDYWASWASSQDHLMTCNAHCFVPLEKLNVTTIIVNGECFGFKPHHCTNFVETFMLNASGQIMNDVLLVFRDGKPFQMQSSLTQKQGRLLLDENLNLGRRRSSRIEEKNRLRMGKHTEIPTTSDPSSEQDTHKQSAKARKEKIPATSYPSSKQDSRKQSAKAVEEKDVKIPLCTDPREPVSVAVLYDPVMLEHKPDFYCLPSDPRMIQRKSKCIHYERPERISCIIDRLKGDNLFDRAVLIQHDLATSEDVVAVHKENYCGFIDERPLGPEGNDKFVGFFTDDMYCSSGTRAAIFSAAGATKKACELVITNKFEKAFAIVRPPGHHAEEDTAEGFCYVNNVAVAANFLRQIYQIRKILVVDWDAHHGNGTEKLFYETDEVLFFNIFNVELDYPLTSELHADRVGRGKGAGHNVNVPLHSGFGDKDMIFVWEELLIPLLKEYCPDLIIVSCGFDAAKGDPLGHAEVSEPCYATLLDMLSSAGNGKIVLSLEGGYNLKVVSECGSRCVRAMVGDREALLPDNLKRGPLMDSTVKVVKTVKRNLARFWDVFKAKPKTKKP